MYLFGPKYESLGKLDSTTLVIFRKEKGCPLCEAEQAKFLTDWLDPITELGVKTQIVYSGEKVIDPVSGVSLVHDPKFQVFKEFGAFDEFENTPVHAVYLLNKESQVLWSVRVPHAFTDWAPLVKELKRLKRLHP